MSPPSHGLPGETVQRRRPTARRSTRRPPKQFPGTGAVWRHARSGFENRARAGDGRDRSQQRDQDSPLGHRRERPASHRLVIANEYKRLVPSTLEPDIHDSVAGGWIALDDRGASTLFERRGSAATVTLITKDEYGSHLQMRASGGRYSTRSPRILRPITSRWIWLVPSPSSVSLASRIKRSTLYSST